MNNPTVRILIVAGEASGDLHGGNLVSAFSALYPGVQFEGVGGKHMRDAGVSTLSDIDRMGGMGLFEFFNGLWHHIQLFRRLSKEIAKGKYQGAILVNYPFFNLRLARVCKKWNCPVFFFISPQVWISRKGRVQDIKETGRKMYVILPFEEKIYSDVGMDVEFPGHPFIDIVKPERPREEARQAFDLDSNIKTVGLFPGSRMSEINFLLEDMVAAAHKIREQLGACQFLLPVADTIDIDLIRHRLGDNPLNIRVIQGGNYDVMNCSDFLIMASGSATLEAGLLGCPMVIVYKMHPLTYFIGKMITNITYFGLINIVAGEGVVPELLNEKVTPEAIAREALEVLQNPEREQALRNRLLQVKRTLGEPGVLTRMARSIAACLNLSTGRPQ